MSNIQVILKYEEAIFINDVESEEEALKIAYNCAIDNYGKEFADSAQFYTEQELYA